MALIFVQCDGQKVGRQVYLNKSYFDWIRSLLFGISENLLDFSFFESQSKLTLDHNLFLTVLTHFLNISMEFTMIKTH